MEENHHKDFDWNNIPLVFIQKHYIDVISDIQKIVGFPVQQAQPKAMEAAGQIDPGSMHRLRKEAKQEKFAGFRQLQMLAQALSPCVSMDQFLPKCLPPETSSEDTLCQLPVLVCTADEERKQTLVGIILL